MQYRVLLSLLLAVFLAAPQCALARFYMPQLQEIPISRLIANIEREVRKHPENLWLKLNLARVHAMAYTMNSDKDKIQTMEGAVSLYEYPRYPWEHRNVFWRTSEPIKLDARTRGHLARALALYAEIIQSTSVDESVRSLALLGHGWCSEQAGDRQTAIKYYRNLLEGSSGQDKRAPLEFEAAGYLLGLLDPVKDADERARLGKRRDAYQKKLNAIPEFITPIAIPLNKGTPLNQIEDLNARVAFDVDPRIPGQHWRWITPRAGWLAYDPKKTGKVASGVRLFGNVSYWMFWDNGYQAMAALDDNGDGVLSGRELEGMVVWVDANSNGVCEPGELKALAELNIKALDYTHVPLPARPDHIVYAPKGVRYADGTTGPSYDIILHGKK